MAQGVDLELLTERELDELLVLATAEKCQEATDNREGESSGGPHRCSIVLGCLAIAED
jgi:hypothetical protein